MGVYKLPTPAKGELYLSAREAAAALVQSGNIKGAAVAMINSKLVPVKSLVRLQAIATRFKKKLPIGSVTPKARPLRGWRDMKNDSWIQ